MPATEQDVRNADKSPQDFLQQVISPDGAVLEQGQPQQGQVIRGPAPRIADKINQQQTPAPESTPAKSIADLEKVDAKGDVKPPVEVKDEDVDFAKFLEVKGETPKTPVAEVKKDIPNPTPDNVIPLQQQLPAKRNYEQFPEGDRTSLTKMSNEAFALYEKNWNINKQKEVELDKIKKEYDEFKQKGPQLPQDYYSHPDGYLLDPAFRQAMEYKNKAQMINDHWQQQLASVAEGAPKFQYLNLNPQTGQYYTTEIPVDKTTEMKLQQYVFHSQNLLQQAGGNVQAMVQGHQLKSQTLGQTLKQFETESFASLMSEQNKAVYEPLIQKELERFGPYRNSPLASIAAKSLVTVQALSRLLNHFQSQGSQGVQQQQQQRVTAQPSGDEAGGGSNNNGKQTTEISMDDFKRAKE